jgi:methylmalonyl-CoA mutase N-terminal domain/subunit
MAARIADSAYRSQQAIERGENIIVGVNSFVEERRDSVPIKLQRVEPAIERAQVERLQSYRAQRDMAQVCRRLDEIRVAACGTANLMPCFLEALDAGATLGEICDVLRTVFGTHSPKGAIA